MHPCLVGAAALPWQPTAAELLGCRRRLPGVRQLVQVGEPPHAGSAVRDLFLQCRGDACLSPGV